MTLAMTGEEQELAEWKRIGAAIPGIRCVLLQTLCRAD